MRIFDRPVIGRRGAIGGAVRTRHDDDRTGLRRVPAHRCLPHPRSEQPRGRCLSRLPPTCRYRVVPPPDRGGGATRIRASSWSLLGSRTIEGLIDLPLMDDPATLATVEVLGRANSPAAFTDANLAALTICKAISLSLEHGNCDASCFAYVVLASLAGPRFGEYQAGFRFGQLGYELVERRGLKRFEASTVSFPSRFSSCAG